jgi:hypothetical protein
MANKNPSPSTRFGVGNPGRAKQKGARDRMTAAFLTALADDFDKHGVQVVKKVRTDDPSTYLRVFANMVPKELEISRSVFDGVSDEDMAEVIRILQEEVDRQKREGDLDPAAVDRTGHTVN